MNALGRVHVQRDPLDLGGGRGPTPSAGLFVDADDATGRPGSSTSTGSPVAGLVEFAWASTCAE
jgi:hypothetical protein